MGGMIRCMKTEYNIYDIENKMNDEIDDTDFNYMLQQIKENNNVYVDFDINKEKAIDHYADNFLGETPLKRRNTVSVNNYSRISIQN